MIAFLKAYGSWVLVAGLLIAFACAGYSCADHRASEAQQVAEVARLNGIVTGLTRQADSLAKIERLDSTTFAAELAGYMRLRDSLLAAFGQKDTSHTTPLSNFHVTVQFATFLQFVHVADSAIKSCQVVLSTCDERAAVLTRKAAVSDSIAAVYAKDRPNIFERHLGPITLGALLAGILAGHALAH